MSDITEIDVPDWVVKAAEDARVRCLNAVTAYGSAGVDERYHMAMKAAITAALGAWVVPACYRLHQPNHSSEWITGMYGGPPMNHKAWSVEQTFTLRQEKPK